MGKPTLRMYVRCSGPRLSFDSLPGLLFIGLIGFEKGIADSTIGLAAFSGKACL